jgi:Protein of unknown function (DUF2846)
MINATLKTKTRESNYIENSHEIPLAPKEKDVYAKSFSEPSSDFSGIYIFRNSFVGQALRKNLCIDDIELGETVNNVFFYLAIAPGNHKITTDYGHKKNELELVTEGGKNYFVEQFIEMGSFYGVVGLRQRSNEEGKDEVQQCRLAQLFPQNLLTPIKQLV